MHAFYADDYSLVLQINDSVSECVACGCVTVAVFETYEK